MSSQAATVVHAGLSAREAPGSDPVWPCSRKTVPTLWTRCDWRWHRVAAHGRYEALGVLKAMHRSLEFGLNLFLPGAYSGRPTRHTYIIRCAALHFRVQSRANLHPLRHESLATLAPTPVRNIVFAMATCTVQRSVVHNPQRPVVASLPAQTWAAPPCPCCGAQRTSSPGLRWKFSSLQTLTCPLPHLARSRLLTRHVMCYHAQPDARSARDTGGSP